MALKYGILLAQHVGVNSCCLPHHRWGCKKQLGPSSGARPAKDASPYPQLMEAIDDFIDALLTPKDVVSAMFG